MTRRLEQELWESAQRALDARKRPLEDESVLALLDAMASQDEPEPRLQALIVELAGLEVALDELVRSAPPLQPPALPPRTRLRIPWGSAAAAAALFFTSPLWWPAPSSHRHESPSAQPALTSTTALRPRRAVLKALEVTVHRKPTTLGPGGQRVQVTSTRTLKKPR